MRGESAVSSCARFVIALASSLLIVACAPPRPAPLPAPPPANRTLTITAQRRQSQRQQDDDKADCQSMASGQPTSSASRVQVFTGCMGGRGYRVE